MCLRRVLLGASPASEATHAGATAHQERPDWLESTGQHTELRDRVIPSVCGRGAEDNDQVTGQNASAGRGRGRE